MLASPGVPDPKAGAPAQQAIEATAGEGGARNAGDSRRAAQGAALAKEHGGSGARRGLCAGIDPVSAIAAWRTGTLHREMLLNEAPAEDPRKAGYWAGCRSKGAPGGT